MDFVLRSISTITDLAIAYADDMDRNSPPHCARWDGPNLARSRASKIINPKLDLVPHIPAEVIAKIVWLLEIEDRESSCGLSKEWKEFGEFFDIQQAIVRHFPRYRYPSLGTPLEYRLLCRRLGRLPCTPFLC